jgi:putative sigma-54 modulation protein
MQISIKGHHSHVSDSARQYIESEVQKIERFYSPIIDCTVTITEENVTKRVEVVTHVHGQTLKASDSDSKLYKATDTALDKMARQLQKLHDRRRNHRPALPKDITDTGE